MFKSSLAVCALVVCISLPARSQAVNMDEYVNQLFFNIFKEKPDTVILGFLKLYAPPLYEKPDRIAGWHVQLSLDTIHGYREMHAFIFKRHPFLNLKFAQGALEIYCGRYDKPAPAITKVQLSLEFESPEDAETAFGRLIGLFTVTATQQKINTTSTSQRAQFTDSKNPSGFNKVQFRVAADNLGRYHYKILFETGNDL